MDRFTRLARLTSATCAVLIVSCGAPRSGGGVALAPGTRASAPATGLRIGRTHVRGLLAYEVAITATSLISVELALAFALVSRDRSSRAETLRIELGDATYDINDLAVDASSAWVASTDGSVRGFDLSDGRELGRWNLGAIATAVALSGDGEYVATGTATGVLCLRRRRDGALLQCIAGHRAAVSAIAIAADSSRLVSASWDGSVVVFALPTLAVLARHREPGSVNDIALSPDDERVALATSDQPPRRSPAVLARERKLGVGRTDEGARVTIWRPASDTSITCHGHGAAVTGVAWTPDGSRVLSSSWDRTVRLWNADDGADIARLTGFNHLVRDLAVTSDGRTAFVAAWSANLDGRALVEVDLLYPRSR